MRSTVVIDRRTRAPVDANDPDSWGKLEHANIASEHSLRIAVWALQHVKATSACPGSRATAETALRAIGASGDLDVTPAGLPVPIKVDRAELAPEYLGDRWGITTAS